MATCQTYHAQDATFAPSSPSQSSPLPSVWSWAPSTGGWWDGKRNRQLFRGILQHGIHRISPKYPVTCLGTVPQGDSHSQSQAKTLSQQKAEDQLFLPPHFRSSLKGLRGGLQHGPPCPTAGPTWGHNMAWHTQAKPHQTHRWLQDGYLSSRRHTPPAAFFF